MEVVGVDKEVPHSKSDADPALYLTTPGITPSCTSTLVWGVADSGYDHEQNSLPGLFDTLESLYSNSEEADKYTVTNHHLVDNGLDLPFHSYTADSRSRHSSNPYATSSIPGEDESVDEIPWHHFTYDSDEQDMHPLSPRNGLASLDTSLPDQLTTSSPFLGSSGLTTPLYPHQRSLSPGLAAAPSYNAFTDQLQPPSSFSSLSPLSLFSNEEHRYISLEGPDAPYAPDPQQSDVADTKLKTPPSPDDTPVKTSIPSTFNSKRRRPSFSSSSDASPESQQCVTFHRRPKRKTTSKAGNPLIDSDSGDDSDDAYIPSRSSSPYESPNVYSRSASPAEYISSKPKKKGVPKGKVLQISAAEALAQLAVETSKSRDDSASPDGQDWEPYNTFDAGRPNKKSKMLPPVPVPHLTKKSRGRKVPHVDTRGSRPSSSEEYYDESGSGNRGTTSRRGRGGARATSGNRTYVCDVPECGKCFVRGEHLKRHVRSIHTNEKPHPCPHDGCNKSFSRRDNLGQHVRLHLLGSS